VIRPKLIMGEDLPLIVLSDHSSGFIQWLIKWRTKANYNHVMSMLWPGGFVSQGNTFSGISLNRYMTPNSRLKFWKIKDLTKEEEKLIYDRIRRRLDRPWWKRGYDHVGVLGQALGLRFINNPWAPYCSEQVKKDFLDDIIGGIRKHPSPKDLNELFKKHPRMEVYGRWTAD